MPRPTGTSISSQTTMRGFFLFIGNKTPSPDFAGPINNLKILYIGRFYYDCEKCNTYG